MIKRRLFLWSKLLLLTLFFLFAFTREWPPFDDEYYRITQLVGLRQFDFFSWELSAFADKAEGILANSDAFLDESQRQQTVLDFLDLVRQVQQLDGQINQIYTDPTVTDPAAATAVLQTELAQKREEMAAIQPVAEAIVQDQVGQVLVDEGFGVLNQAWPPVMMRMTPLPSLLIVSPRDHIERIYGISLVPGLSTAEMDALETAIFEQLNLSALVVPIGGMGTYPAMIMETSSINWLAEVTSHEWSHHWLSFFPVGWNYGDPQVRIINETIASIFDQEIGSRVIERYYPEYVPPPAPATLPAQTAPTSPVEPPAFDFGAELAATRIHTEELLAMGDIEGAEAYMEAQRQVFLQNGYGIRKLNQAYFAFHGAYAAVPGATGSDPTGPMLLDIQASVDSPREFMETVAPITTFADLEEIWNEVVVLENQ
ncbi:MAG: hypothetical protein H6652_14400 [Ardenticatenaceae bacterium]|nr:hypothetical protein [Ardenticatenaceae bacterium]MCB8947620.1 hypothetical protein [Ardenticatenaceae bacterium]